MTAFFEAEDALEFFRAINRDKVLARKFTMYLMVSTMLGLETPVKSPLQSKKKSSRAAEIALTYGKDDWCQAPYVAAVYTKYKETGGQRQASEFDRVGDLVVQDGNDELLVRDLVLTQSVIVNDIQDAYDKWRKEIGDKEDETRRKALAGLRSHQATKVGKHTVGKFFLLERLRDGQPMILISSEPNKDIDAKYITQTQALSHPSEGGGKEVRGFYRQDIKAKTFLFVCTKGNCDAALVSKALRVLKKERKVTEVSDKSDLGIS